MQMSVFIDLSNQKSYKILTELDYEGTLEEIYLSIKEERFFNFETENKERISVNPHHIVLVREETEKEKTDTDKEKTKYKKPLPTIEGIPFKKT